MAEKKIGKVIYRKALSGILEIFRLAPADGSAFPEYKAGQYIALSRDNCRLTRKIITPEGNRHYEYDRDESGNPNRGSVTHSYSISSAPWETRREGYLEFYVVLEMVETGTPGRLSESLFRIDPGSDNAITYVNKIVGDFTLDKRAAGYENVIMVGTGTGLAPLVSMIKQLDFEASEGNRHAAAFTLIHANRTFQELGYHQQLLLIESGRRLDFLYLPSVSRPSPRDRADERMGKGRANNILRKILGMTLKEEEDLQKAVAEQGDVQRARQRLESTVLPELPAHCSREILLKRMNPGHSVVITCGNPAVMSDVEYIAGAAKMRFEKEEW
jgi:ferredoxin-NADP reductase